MLDVHPPHEPVHGWRDFLLHILTITIGLLIALGLEGCVEWIHHRHLVHEAEASLYTEIKNNESATSSLLDSVHQQQDTLKKDVVFLDRLIANPKISSHGELSLAFRMVTLEDVSWRTAQNTGALAFMPYERAQEYAGIYALQQQLNEEQTQGIRDTVLGIGLFANEDPKDPDEIARKARTAKERMEVIQGQLFLVDSTVKTLDRQYKSFLAAHQE